MHISSGLIFFNVSSNVFCCNAHSEKLFSKNRFLTFLYAPLHLSVLRRIVYQNNEFYWSLALNFFTRFFCFLLSKVDGVLLSILIAVL